MLEISAENSGGKTDLPQLAQVLGVRRLSSPGRNPPRRLPGRHFREPPGHVSFPSGISPILNVEIS
jgi:hypothetical protein